MNILHTVDDLQKEKITLEKNIKEKKEAKELLKQLTKTIAILVDYLKVNIALKKILLKFISYLMQ